MPYTPNFAAGDVLTAANMNSIGEAWTIFTPTWTSSGTPPALGNGINVGYYCQVNKVCFVNIQFAMGTTSTYGTGTYFWALPSGVNVKTANMPADTPIGVGHLEEQQTSANLPLTVMVQSATTVRFAFHIPGTGGAAADFVQYGNVRQTAPYTWLNSGTVRRATIRASFCYEVA